MTLDLAKWQSGTVGDPSTDPNLNTAPVMNDHRKDWPTTGELYLQADNASLMLSPPDSDEFDIYFERTDDKRHKYEVAEDGTEINAIGSRIGAVSALQVWRGLNLFDYFGVAGENQEFYDWGLTREIIVGYDGISSANPTVSTELFVPYAWAGPAGRDGLDLAEILWSWIKFHSSLLTEAVMDADAIDSTSFIAYSSRMEDWRYRQRFKFYRSVGRTLREDFADLARASNCYFGWGHDSGATKTLALRMHDYRDLPENTRIFRFDHSFDEENPLALRRDRSRRKDQNIVNQRAIRWGTIVQVSTGAPPLTATLGQPPSPPDDENLIEMEEASSVADYGPRPKDSTSPWVLNGGSAVGAYRITDTHAADREVVLSQGPLHLDYWPGEIIHVRDVLHDLDGTEQLYVRSKDYNLDNLTVVTYADQLAPAPYLLNPENLDDLTRVFAYYRADAGISSSGGRVTAWVDQIGVNDLSQHGSLPNPKLLTAYQNGKNVVHFDGDNIGAGGGGVLDLIIGSTSPKMNLTVLALLEIDNTSQLTNNLLGSDGRLSASSDEWLIQCGNSNANGMGWGWNAANLQNDGPVLPTTGWVIAIWQPWTIKANWALHDGNRSFAKWVDMASASAQLDDHHVDGGYDSAPLLFTEGRVDWDRSTIIGADKTGANRLRARMATLLIMQHPASDVSNSLGIEHGPVLPHEIEGFANYWASEWGL